MSSIGKDIYLLNDNEKNRENIEVNKLNSIVYSKATILYENKDIYIIKYCEKMVNGERIHLLFKNGVNEEERSVKYNMILYNYRKLNELNIIPPF